MRRTRFASLAAGAVALLLTTAAVAPAGAASTGVGTSQASTSLLDVALGSAGNALKLNLLSDKAQASIDPKVSNPAKAIADLSPLRIASSLVPALNQNVPGLHTESTGAEQKSTVPAIPLSVPPVLSGTITPPNLSSLVDASGAVAGITAGVKDLSVVAGLLSIPNATLDLGAKALKSDASGLRGINVTSLDLANVGTLLRGLGIDPANLPLNKVTGLLDALGLPLNIGGQSLNGAAVLALVTNLTGSITSLQGAIGTLTGASPVAIPAPLTGLLDTVNNTLPAVPLLSGTTDAANALGVLDGLTDQLSNVLNSALGGLLNSPLLSVKNVVVGLNTKAADTLANSVAGVTAKIGSIRVGALNLGGVDLGAPVAQVSGLVNQVNTTLSNVLGVVGLGDLLKVGLFTQEKKVNEAGGYTHALASLSALNVKLTPPAALVGIVNGLLQPTGILSNVGGSSVSSLLSGLPAAGGAGTTVPVIGGLMPQLNSLLGQGGLGALAGGVSADLVKVASTANFALVGSAPAGSPQPVAELPMTGGSQFAFVVGLLFLATGAGLARWMWASRSEA